MYSIISIMSSVWYMMYTKCRHRPVLVVGLVGIVVYSIV